MSIPRFGTGPDDGAALGLVDGRMAPTGRGASAPDLRAPAVVQMLLLADAAAVLAATGLSVVAAGLDGGRGGPELGWMLVYVPFVLLAFSLSGLYGGDRRGLTHSTWDDASDAFRAGLLATLGLYLYLYLTSGEMPGLVGAALLLVLLLTLVLAARAGARAVAAHAPGPERVLLVGGGGTAGLVARALCADRGWRRLLPVGYLEDVPATAPPHPAPDLPCVGTPAELATACDRLGVRRAVIAGSPVEGDGLPEILMEAEKAGVTVSVVPPIAEVLGPSTAQTDLHRITVMALRRARRSRLSPLLKRSLDVAASAAALMVLVPLLPVVALVIRLDTRGPALFRQERVGRDGRRFRVLKLRTMVCDAEARVGELQSASAHPAWLLLERDPRVTRVGRWLRVTSLDELPQLWNVLRGEMSLVGPRPMPLPTDGHIDGWARRRLEVRPGITGLWQVMGRTSIPFEEMLRLDYLYVATWTVLGDLRLIARTFGAVLGRQGAN